jgi:ribosomal protein S18 acetylase RimI-like enzyme
MATIRKATEADVDSIVLIHLNAFQGFFLSMLGKRFLHELYTGFIQDGDTIFLIAEQGSNVAGFIVGTTQPNRFFKQLLKNRWFALLLCAVPALLRHPWFVGKKLFSALAYRGENPKKLDQGALLSSIAVAPAYARQGIGESLVREFCESANRQGTHYVCLTTDRHNNDAVNLFYQRQGFTLESVFSKTGKREMNRYIYFLEAKEREFNAKA